MSEERNASATDALPAEITAAIKEGPSPAERFNDEWKRRELFAERIAKMAYERGGLDAIKFLGGSSPVSAVAGTLPDMTESGWTPEQALRFYAEGKHFDVVDGRTRILDTGAVASDALKGISGEYAESKGCVSPLTGCTSSLSDMTPNPIAGATSNNPTLPWRCSLQAGCESPERCMKEGPRCAPRSTAAATSGETPRTDAFAKGLGRELSTEAPRMMMAFARQLERELAAEKADHELTVRTYRDVIEPRHKSIEAERDALRSATAAPFGPTVAQQMQERGDDIMPPGILQRLHRDKMDERDRAYLFALLCFLWPAQSGTAGGAPRPDRTRA